MKVIVCAYDDPNYVGGPNTWLRRIAPVWQNAGIEVVVLLITPQPQRGLTVKALRRAGIRCLESGYRERPLLRQRVQWILSCVAEENPDVFVPNLLVPAYYAADRVKDAGIPTIGIMRSDDPFYWAVVERFVEEISPHRVSGFVCVSEFLRASVSSRAGNGVEVVQIPSGAPVPRASATHPEDRMRLIYVGRLEHQQKRIIDVARSFCRAVREVPGTEAIIYGDGRARHEVERLLEIEGKGLPVQLMGNVDSEYIQDHLLKAHAIVLLSDYEGLPIAFMEAMACGVVPICTSMRSGIPELVEHNATGLIVADSNEGFVDAVRRLRSDTVLWTRLSRSARARIESDYSIDVCARRWIELLHRIARKAGGGKSIDLTSKLVIPPAHREFVHQEIRLWPIKLSYALRLVELYALPSMVSIYKAIKKELSIMSKNIV